jgi:hypothetical protein
MAVSAPFRSLAVLSLVASLRGVAAQAAAGNSSYDVLTYVNQLIGSANGGELKNKLSVLS